MKPYHKYMLLYTTLQLIGVIGITKLSEWERIRREAYALPEKLNK